MERYIVLAYEMVNLAVFPIMFPVFLNFSIFISIFSNGNICYRRVKPAVKNKIAVVFKRNFDTPFKISSNAPRLQTFINPSKCKCTCILRPVLLLLYPFLQFILKQWKINKKVFLLSELN